MFFFLNCKPCVESSVLPLPESGFLPSSSSKVKELGISRWSKLRSSGLGCQLETSRFLGGCCKGHRSGLREGDGLGKALNG